MDTNQVVSVLPREILLDELASLRQKWPSMPKVTVVNTVDELPGARKDAHCDAYHRNGYRDVFIVGGNIRSIEQLRKAVAHECILHYSLEDMLGSYGFAKLQEGLARLKADGDPLIVAIADDIAKRYGELSPKDEAREIVAAAGERLLDPSGNISIKYGFMKGVYAGIAGRVRDLGIPVALTTTELHGLIYEAAKTAAQPTIDAPAARGGEPQHYVSEGRFSGRIVEVTSDHLVQKVGRADTDVVQHSLERLSGFAAKGDVVDIVYRNGVGVLAINGLQLER